MDDGTLAGYIPTYGDRIAARRFCLESKGANTTDSKKHSLLEKLKKKMGIDSNDETNSDQAQTTKSKRTRQYAKSNKWAEKKTRRIELGWIHDGKQVRKRKGGGTRTLDVPKGSKKSDLINYAKDLFFPNGKCKFGDFETFSHDILDFQEEAVLDENVSVGELYNVLRLGMLRFYLCTKTHTSLDAEEYVEEKSDGNNVEMMNIHEDDQVTETIVILSSDFELDPDAQSNTSEVTFGPVLGELMAGELNDTLIYQPSMQFDGDDSDFTSVELPSTNADITPVSGDSASSSAASYELVCVNIKLHRINLLEEMIWQFKDQTLLRQKLKFSFIDEKGADADGVSRDVYAAFWSEFMDRIAEGEEVRVPSLPNKWQQEEWKSIGRILLKGFKDHGYFPCRLAPAFSVALIFGENDVSDEMLFESLLLYISQSDRDLLTTALKADHLDEDQDELIDLLDRLNVTTLPTQDNLKGILLNAAHKHLIQKPRYAAEQMSSTASHILKEFFPCPQAVLQMYEEKKPTTKRFLKLLNASPTTQSENQSFRFLQQYIRGLDNAGLRRMLRFVTGSDVICVNKVEVLFTPVEGLARRPIAHTCGPTLELPWTYVSYPDLRAEMDSILLNQNSLEFSIV